MSKKQQESDYLKAHRSIYDSLTRAFKHFNTELFNDVLPEVVITLTRQARTAGYFRHSAYHNRSVDLTKGITKDQLETQFRHEIAINPNYFTMPSEHTYSSLVHELVHLQQAMFGNFPRNGYHNKEWAEMMEVVGLIPSSTGKPGGRKTGQQMSDYVEVGGRYQIAYQKLIAKEGETLQWAGVPEPEVILPAEDNITEPLAVNTSSEAKRKSKTKYLSLIHI